MFDMFYTVMLNEMRNFKTLTLPKTFVVSLLKISEKREFTKDMTVLSQKNKETPLL